MEKKPPSVKSDPELPSEFDRNILTAESRKFPCWLANCAFIREEIHWPLGAVIDSPAPTKSAPSISCNPADEKEGKPEHRAVRQVYGARVLARPRARAPSAPVAAVTVVAAAAAPAAARLVRRTRRASHGTGVMAAPRSTAATTTAAAATWAVVVCAPTAAAAAAASVLPAAVRAERRSKSHEPFQANQIDLE